MMSKPLADRPGLAELLRKSAAAFNAMTSEEQRAHIQVQRKSWVVGETMLHYPEMTRTEAEALYDKVAL